jgi:hypothetical protein
MSSPQPSSTQGSDVVSMSPPSPPSYRNLTESDIVKEIEGLRSQGIQNVADDNIISHCEFVYNKDIRGDILAPKKRDVAISEFVLAGIFEIDARNFFMTSDGKWNSNNPLGTRFEQVKPSCHLLPALRQQDFSQSVACFPGVIANLRAIEALANPRKTRDTYSLISGDSPQSSTIKLSHQLFVVRFFFFGNFYMCP